MRRCVVAGAGGFFGRELATLLNREGLNVVATDRRGLDVEDGASLTRALRRSDVVLDAAGPFQRRGSALIERAMAIGADVVDLSDSLAYALRVGSLEPRIAASGIRVLTSCSAVSALAAGLVTASGVREPTRVSALLVPAVREAARGATYRALLASVGEPIRVFRGGRLETALGWGERRDFGGARGYLVENALSVTLPAAWPSLRDVALWVDANAFGASRLLRLASRWRGLGAALRGTAALALAYPRLLGGRGGSFGVEIEDASGRVARLAVGAPRRSYLAAVAPAVLAARALADGSFSGSGLIRSDRLVDAETLFAYLAELGIGLRRDRANAARAGAPTYPAGP